MFWIWQWKWHVVHMGMVVTYHFTSIGMWFISDLLLASKWHPSQVNQSEIPQTYVACMCGRNMPMCDMTHDSWLMTHDSWKHVQVWHDSFVWICHVLVLIHVWGMLCIWHCKWHVTHMGMEVIYHYISIHDDLCMGASHAWPACATCEACQAMKATYYYKKSRHTCALFRARENCTSLALCHWYMRRFMRVPHVRHFTQGKWHTTTHQLICNGMSRASLEWRVSHVMCVAHVRHVTQMAREWGMSFMYETCHAYGTCPAYSTCEACRVSVEEKEVSLQEILSGFEFVPGLFGIVLRGRYLYGAWPRTVLILIEFKFIVPELWQLVVFYTCRILPEGLKFVEKFPTRWHMCEVCHSYMRCSCIWHMWGVSCIWHTYKVQGGEDS